MADVDLWMPFYVSDYLAKTTRLSTLHHGVYLLMLLDLWKNGPIPDDDAVLARVVGLDADAWSIARRTIQAFFMIEDGVWTHARIEKELERAKKNRASASEKAGKAAAERWRREREKDTSNNASGNAPSIDQAMLKQCPSPSPSPSPSQPPAPAQTDMARSRKKPSISRPADWQPNEQHRAIASELRLNIGEQLVKFTDWADSKAMKYADWNAGFRNWLRNAPQYNRSGPSTLADTRRQQGIEWAARSNTDDLIGEASHVGD